VAALAAAAAFNAVADRIALYRSPPRGRFVDVDGQRVHLVETGSGPPVLLVHGNGATVEELLSSGLVDELAQTHRVIVPDRPGFGHSPPPRGRPWTVSRHARLLARLVESLGVGASVVLGQSLGASIALAMAIDHPEQVRGLVLVSGYYEPFEQGSLTIQRPFAVPVLGPLLAATVAPLMSRALYGMVVRRMFQPRPVPGRFMQLFPHGLALRRSQLLATGAAAGMVRNDMRRYWPRVPDLRVPALIFAGDGDRILSGARHARALRDRLPRGRAGIFGRTGHMVHHAYPAAIAAAVAELPAVEAQEAPMAAMLDEVPAL
jgi:pimeloyl-ACP methyl ester carboxylesterase